MALTLALGDLHAPHVRAALEVVETETAGGVSCLQREVHAARVVIDCQLEWNATREFRVGAEDRRQAILGLDVAHVERALRRALVRDSGCCATTCRLG